MSGYIGRFAPSPTGLLHFGSLLAALASYLDARAHQGLWLVRIEDLDPPREMPGAAAHILRTLERLQLHWDGTVRYQHQQQERYQTAIDLLLAQQQAYPCSCSRKQLDQRHVSRGPQGQVYDRYCLTQAPAAGNACAIRLKVEQTRCRFIDRVQGPVEYDFASLGDVVIRRKDGPFAYQLAVVLDDADQGITHIVRGSDLLDSTPWQVSLQQALLLPQPSHAHIPVIVNNDGQKLSKQTFAQPLDTGHTSQLICAALDCLHHPLPDELRQAPVSEQLAWAVQHWQIEHLPAELTFHHPYWGKS
ncbi:tRNA glutamyl-Q(34) synthetase GluQRS [Pokkaliibacter plantistimulans]|uniref:Glutamyl-Q tRNA(Asp) synthetase n=1 Tax=Proteobacteria bacterium 228 TaxID=2083153 RepID=A0A2S5KX81_9PROT|nr:tRNA glutamyl-Q(34) synthetase GluQRS [Pokkaliibacter plantistimulans]PPC79109.1 tRNA glutamyl-Q(34) synthetase GluQRS [Pokkaliibacter plantistimulans]